LAFFPHPSAGRPAARNGKGRGLALAAALLLGLGLGAGGAAFPARAGDLPAEPVVNPGKPSVRVIQQQLQRNGYAPGPVNGRLDAQTRAAVRSFQADCGLPADSSAGGTLTEKLIRPQSCPAAGSK
jgi:peptidoglycan hydrolase-like protein with peptidoglycan-binding domain